MKRVGVLASLTSLVLAAALVSGCSRAALLDVAMRSAPRPRATDGHDRVGPFLLLAGDMHTHVLPPDAPSHVTRTLEETAGLAREEGLDFVVLTPHVPARFYLRSDKRQWVRETQAELRAGIAALRSPVLFVPGMEYTDHVWGHVGLAFADLEAVLEAVPVGDAFASPALFFERWRDAGGIATLNHPSVHGIPDAPIRDLRYDLSWRAFPPPNADPRAPAIPGARTGIPPEIAWLTRHAPAIETFNLSIAFLRDQYFLHDESYTTRETLALVDREARARRRRIANVGGSDSHGRWLRATTWVLARERTIPAIRDAILSGRTCVRGPEACSLEVEHEGAWHPVGTSLPTTVPADAGGRAVRVRVGTTPLADATTTGARATFLVNGVAQAEAAAGAVVSLTVPGRCSAIHAVVGRSISSAIYVDCPFE